MLRVVGIIHRAIIGMRRSTRRSHAVSTPGGSVMARLTENRDPRRLERTRCGNLELIRHLTVDPTQLVSTQTQSINCRILASAPTRDVYSFKPWHTPDEEVGESP
jgi:hypothetical protein